VRFNNRILQEAFLLSAQFRVINVQCLCANVRKYTTLPLRNCQKYQPPLLLRNGHLNTLYAYFNCKLKGPDYQREIMETGDGDFVELDWKRQGSASLIVLLHGLEGSSKSTYIRRMAAMSAELGWDVCALHHRSCGGKMNRLPTLYHSGYTRDLHEFLQLKTQKYQKVRIVGYSLGGNVLLKYLGDGIYPIPANVHSAVAVSVPVHLRGCAIELSKFSNRVYEIGFLRGLKRKMLKKSEIFPELISAKKVRAVKRLVEFDNEFTAPLNNFNNAWDYYDQSGSLRFLSNIQVPTLLINAKDDPMLSEASFPYEIAKNAKHFYFCATDYGGHVGFANLKESYYWIDKEIVDFLTDKKL